MNLSLVFFLIGILGFVLNRKNAISIISTSNFTRYNRFFYYLASILPASHNPRYQRFFYYLAPIFTLLGYVVIPYIYTYIVYNYNLVILSLLAVSSLSTYLILLVSSCKESSCSILGLLDNNYKLILSGITILISVFSVLLLIAVNVYDNPIYTLLVLISALIALYSLTFHFNNFKGQYPVFTSILLVTLFLIVVMTSCMLVGQLLSILCRLFMNQAGPSNNSGGGNGGAPGGWNGGAPGGGNGGAPGGGGSYGPGPGPGPGGKEPHYKRYRRTTLEEHYKSRNLYRKGNRIYKWITKTDSPFHKVLLEGNKTALIEVADLYEEHRLSLASKGVLIKKTRSEWIEAAKSYKAERQASA